MAELDLASFSKQLQTASTTQILDLILQGAISLSASDIHLEPQEKDLRVRFRIDGILKEGARLSQEAQKALTTRIKFLAKMDLNIKDAPQDGRFTQEIQSRHFDFRCATLPLTYGEELVIRILEQEQKFFTLKELGFRKEMVEQIESMIKKPYGMVLNVGPTGCGKTTTLYAILNELNKPGVKIITLEDPVEYRLEGLAQSQINEEEGLTFAEALKGALRSDPDIVMVGEIRDTETANIALQAALSGHLVLSTFHANEAASALVRLTEIGIKSYLLSGSINAVMAQRLVRKICLKCKEKIPIDQRVIKYLEAILPGYKIPAALFKGRGCPECGNTGYKGRTAIGEILVPDAEIEELIIKKAPLKTIIEKSKKAGFLNMEQDGLLKVLEGITTLEEVFRVTRV